MAPKSTTSLNEEQRVIRTPFNRSPRVQLVCPEPSLTQQEFTEECDINNVILRFSATGELPPRVNARVAEYLDVSEIGDLHQALTNVRAVREAYDALPAEVRQATGNDPERLLDALDEHARYRASTLEDVSVPNATPPASPPAP